VILRQQRQRDIQEKSSSEKVNSGFNDGFLLVGLLHFLERRENELAFYFVLENEKKEEDGKKPA